MIAGHKAQWNFLCQTSKIDKLPHAYLFYGQEKLGKKTVALEFAKFLNCKLKDGQKGPCQNCHNCQSIQNKIFPDLIFIEPEESGQISISQIRNLIQKMSFKAYSSSVKIAIIDKCETMTSESQNCFLKLLEEPKGNSLLMLISAHKEQLLPTMISRVQKLGFFPVKDSEIKSYISSEELKGEPLEYVLSLSLGRPGLAIEYSQNPQKVKDQKRFVSDFIRLAKSDLSERFQYAKTLADKDVDNSKYNLREALNIWLYFLRKLFILRIEESKMKSLAKIKKTIESLQHANFLISKTNINQRLTLELFLMEL